MSKDNTPLTGMIGPLLSSLTSNLENATSDIVLLQHNALLANTYQDPHPSLHPMSRNFQLRRKSVDASTAETEDFKSILSHFQRHLPNPESFTEFKLSKNELKHGEDPIQFILTHTQPLNTISRLTLHNDQTMMEAHRKLSKSSSSTAFCAVAAHKNYLHKYSWPKRLINNIEGVEKLHKKRRKKMTQILQIGSEDFISLEVLSNEIKHFIVSGKGNNLIWESNMSVIPNVRCEDIPFRNPTGCATQLAKQIFEAHDNYAATSPFHGHLQRSLTERLSLNNILQSRYEDVSNISRSYYNPLNQSLIEPDVIRKEIIVGLLGRHIEGLTDATIHMVFDILKPFLEICNAPSGESPMDNETQIFISQAKGYIERDIKYSEDTNGDKLKIEVTPADLRILTGSDLEKDGNGENTDEQPRRSHHGKRRSDCSEDHKSSSKRHCPTSTAQSNKRLSMDDVVKLKALKSTSDPDPTIVTWKHVLFALQSVSDQTGPQHLSYHVHDSLPSLPLNPSVVERIKQRITSIYSRTDIPGITKVQPQILPRTNLDKRVTDHLEKNMVL